MWHRLGRSHYARYMVLGGPLEDLGAPVNDTVVDSDGEHTDYAGGTLYWKTGTYNVYRQDGPVAQRWLSEQGSSGWLGHPTSDTNDTRSPGELVGGS
jgi:uncharacterized protein with LGFP repeats